MHMKRIMNLRILSLFLAVSLLLSSLFVGAFSVDALAADIPASTSSSSTPLLLHYDFTSSADGVIEDISGNGGNTGWLLEG